MEAKKPFFMEAENFFHFFIFQNEKRKMLTEETEKLTNDMLFDILISGDEFSFPCFLLNFKNTSSRL